MAVINNNGASPRPAQTKKPRKPAKKPSKRAAPRKKKTPSEPVGVAFARPGTAFVPTKDQRNVVMLAKAVGYSEEHIASLIINPDTHKHISETTLKKHFTAELSSGKNTVLMNVAGTLVGIATDKAHRGCVTAGIYLTKVWGRWREPEPEWAEKKRVAELQRDEDDGGDIEIEVELVLEDQPPLLPPPTVQ